MVNAYDNLNPVTVQKTECAFCPMRFFKRSGGQRFCSKRCAQLARQIVPAHVFCKQCGKKFTPRHPHTDKLFCTVQCQGLARRGENHPLYRGGRMRTPAGYRQILQPDGKYLMEHRLVMEQQLGRLLLAEETVHHKNGQRADNRPENLELWSTRHPKGQRVEDKVAWAVDFLRQYAPELLA